MTNCSPFFPELNRRAEYQVKSNGNYYQYSHYRQEIREDCLGRCVYCDGHENELGGIDSMVLDHFRPTKYEEHKHLKNDPNNLVWACPGCNHLKSSHWPALGMQETFVDNTGFIDPFNENLNEYFKIKDDGSIVALKPPANYKIKLLSLNRITRKRIRELRNIKLLWIKGFEENIQKIEFLLKQKGIIEKIEEILRSHLKWLLSTKSSLEKALLDFNLY
ncbi:MAG: HNH endonuclease [Sedimentisphaerales bacterium]|nr:HNH endonuclease [Sedimentisphaerales bacterium]